MELCQQEACLRKGSQRSRRLTEHGQAVVELARSHMEIFLQSHDPGIADAIAVLLALLVFWHANWVNHKKSIQDMTPGAPSKTAV